MKDNKQFLIAVVAIIAIVGLVLGLGRGTGIMGTAATIPEFVRPCIASCLQSSGMSVNPSCEIVESCLNSCGIPNDGHLDLCGPSSM